MKWAAWVLLVALVGCKHRPATVLAPAPPTARFLRLGLDFTALGAAPDERSKRFAREFPRAMRSALIDAGYQIVVDPGATVDATLEFGGEIYLEGTQFTFPRAEVSVRLIGRELEERLSWRELLRLGLAVRKEGEVAKEAATVLTNALAETRLMR